MFEREAKMSVIPGRKYPILVCMHCGGDLKKAEGGYKCKECGEPFTMEEAGLQNVEVTNIEDEERKASRR